MPATAFTLIEMLVALAVTLVMMAAVVNLFANISGSVRNRRAVIEISGQLRQVRLRMARDLAGATCDATTWQQPAENRGYIEILEGRLSDKVPSSLLLDKDGDGQPFDGFDVATSQVPSSQVIDPDAGMVTDGRALGDWDDVLALTVRSEAEPFTMKTDNGTPNDNSDDKVVESTLAEVVWFAGEDDEGDPPPREAGMRRIYRRALLIAPWLGPWPGRPDHISVRFENDKWIANTLGDLTKRENRIARNPNQNPFPHVLRRNDLNSEPQYLVLADALAFDLRVFDPGAPLFQATPTVVVDPVDLGWQASAKKLGSTNNPPPETLPVGYGAFCDLGWGWDQAEGVQIYPPASLPPGAPAPVFAMQRGAGWHLPTPANYSPFPAVYDTWSYHYENDGLNQDDNDVVDQGANGLDDNNQFGVDDMGERETSPPYDVSLRGVKVILRVYERDARQIREASVTHSFVQ